MLSCWLEWLQVFEPKSLQRWSLYELENLWCLICLLSWMCPSHLVWAFQLHRWVLSSPLELELSSNRVGLAGSISCQMCICYQTIANIWKRYLVSSVFLGHCRGLKTVYWKLFGSTALAISWHTSVESMQVGRDVTCMSSSRKYLQMKFYKLVSNQRVRSPCPAQFTQCVTGMWDFGPGIELWETCLKPRICFRLSWIKLQNWCQT